MIIGNTTYKGVNGFSEDQLHLMKTYLQGAVYCRCMNCKDEWFAARNHKEASIQYAIEEVGKSAGCLLKVVLFKDKRTFETRDGFTRI